MAVDLQFNCQRARLCRKKKQEKKRRGREGESPNDDDVRRTETSPLLSHSLDPSRPACPALVWSGLGWAGVFPLVLRVLEWFAFHPRFCWARRYREAEGPPSSPKTRRTSTGGRWSSPTGTATIIILAASPFVTTARSRRSSASVNAGGPHSPIIVDRADLAGTPSACQRQMEMHFPPSAHANAALCWRRGRRAAPSGAQLGFFASHSHSHTTGCGCACSAGRQTCPETLDDAALGRVPRHLCCIYLLSVDVVPGMMGHDRKEVTGWGELTFAEILQPVMQVSRHGMSEWSPCRKQSNAR